MTVELDIHDDFTRGAVALFSPDLVIAPFLKRPAGLVTSLQLSPSGGVKTKSCRFFFRGLREKALAQT
ncbi:MULTISPECIES: hypothetical protein [Mesorhizobium]|uniref:hypothetical protein n=1 Tax=Mesorhizobium TaxID=68287 RepID=UPI001FCE5F74|nr:MULTISPECIES: hypothetical protein [Mesorhizobium]